MFSAALCYYTVSENYGILQLILICRDILSVQLP